MTCASREIMKWIVVHEIRETTQPSDVSYRGRRWSRGDYKLLYRVH